MYSCEPFETVMVIVLPAIAVPLGDMEMTVPGVFELSFSITETENPLAFRVFLASDSLFPTQFGTLTRS